jgi:hypothetical protein
MSQAFISRNLPDPRKRSRISHPILNAENTAKELVKKGKMNEGGK